MLEEISVGTLELDSFTTIGNDWMLVTAGTAAKWNTMTAAWGCLGYLWDRNVVILFVRQSRYTHDFLERSSGFTCSFFPAGHRSDLRYLGSHSGRKEDKVAKTGLTPVKLTDGRMSFAEANLVFSCTKASRTDLSDATTVFLPDVVKANYPDRKDWHTLYIGFIDKVYADL